MLPAGNSPLTPFVAHLLVLPSQCPHAIPVGRHVYVQLVSSRGHMMLMGKGGTRRSLMKGNAAGWGGRNMGTMVTRPSSLNWVDVAERVEELPLPLVVERVEEEEEEEADDEDDDDDDEARLVDVLPIPPAPSLLTPVAKPPPPPPRTTPLSPLHVASMRSIAPRAQQQGIQTVERVHVHHRQWMYTPRHRRNLH